MTGKSMKLATTYDVEGKPMNGYETVEAQICPGEKNEKLHVIQGRTQPARWE